MSRETFNPLGESEQKEKGLRDLYEEATRNYEESLGVPPPEDWTTEEIVKALDEEAEKERLKRSEIEKRDVSGLRGPIYKPRQFDETQGVVKREVAQRGQRSGRKRQKHGRETIRQKEAA